MECLDDIRKRVTLQWFSKVTKFWEANFFTTSISSQAEVQLTKEKGKRIRVNIISR